MLKDITLGQYFPGNSVIHRLDHYDFFGEEPLFLCGSCTFGFAFDSFEPNSCQNHTTWIETDLFYSDLHCDHQRVLDGWRRGSSSSRLEGARFLELAYHHLSVGSASCDFYGTACGCIDYCYQCFVDLYYLANYFDGCD